MSAKIDPVEVAKRLCEPRSLGYAFTTTQEEYAAVAKVVIAADEVNASIPATFDPRDGSVQRHAKALNALAAALKGE